MIISVIAAIAKNGVIGRSNGEMPWHVKEEFQHFRNTTLGYPLIMGRKSYDALGKPLKGRLNIVLTRNGGFNPGYEEVLVFNDMNEALAHCKKASYERAFIIGGGKIFEEYISIADEMILSFMNFDAVGDVLFPEINKDVWDMVSVEKRSEFDIKIFKRRKAVRVE